ncbi:YbaN family protein [Ancylobacter dichloromethanicus]|nr:YbaN family protein [Ancylobacter dichloromethanicus]
MRWAMFALAWVCVGLGIVGIVTPVMPGTVFLILAAWLFTRSSPRFERWLLTHPRLGPSVVAWRASGAVPRWAQLVAAGSMAFSFAVLVVLGLSVPVLAIVAAVFVGVSAYLLTRPTS